MESSMAFWGVEVKAGEPVKVNPQIDEVYIHLSQASLGEATKDKGSEPVLLYVTVDEKKFVLGTLTRDNLPQLSFDLVLEREFELSHNWKNGSVYFCGYKAFIDQEDDDDEYDSFDPDEDADLPLLTKDNGKPAQKTEEASAPATKNNTAKMNSEKQVKVVDPKKEEEDEDDDDESDDEDNETGSSDEDMMDADSDSDEESESDEDDKETPPKKADQGKKRTNDSASKTPVPSKKAKSVTPQKTDGKKGAYTATPYPMKKGGKTPNSGAKDQTPKSGGQFSCKTCSKSFNSEGGLQQHAKAKHGGQ